MSEFKQVIENRRSIEVLTTSSISQNDVLDLVKHAILYSPSAFNAQSVSAMVLFEDSHHQLWEEVKRQIIPFVPKEKQDKTINKIKGFKGGDGTIIFLEDTEVAATLREKFTLYQENVDLWVDQGQGFAQHAVWLALSDANLSASLQHYNPLIDPFIMKNYDVDSKYQVVAQMPFGKANSKPKIINRKKIEDRVWKK